MVFITNEGLKKLDEYKYKSGGYSKLDNIINPFWERVQKLLPQRMAPNLVTFVGFIFMALSYLCMLPYDLTFTQEIPSWTFFFAAFCQFVYQTLDAVDGKHARETKSSSPLGQLFDHGCDSFSNSFIFLSIAQACRMNDPTTLVLFVFIGQLNFFASNWSEYHTKVLKTHIGNFGVTEAELLVIGILLFTGIFGQDVWDISAIDYLDPNNEWTLLLLKDPLTKRLIQLQIKNAILTGMEIGGIVMVGRIFYETLEITKKKLEAALQYVPILMLFFAVWAWRELEIFKIQTATFMLTSGLIFSFITSKLIVCSLTEMTAPYLSIEALIMLTFGVMMRVFHGTSLHKYDHYIVWGLLGFVIIAIVDWIYESIGQITSYLGIYCFSLEKRPRRLIKTD